MKLLVIFSMLFIGLQVFAQENAPTKMDSLVAIAKAQLGVPYKWATSNPNVSFDCSGFTHYVYKSIGITSSRSSKVYGSMGSRVSLEECQVGDCILFSGTQPGSRTIGHVGIVIEKNAKGMKFIHCSSSKKHFGVSITDYYNSNYTKRFLQVRRLQTF